MGLAADLTFVFLAGLATDLATGLGVLPFFFVDDVGDRWNVALWGVASGIMVSASLFGLVNEGLAESTGLPVLLAAGFVAGMILVVVADAVLERLDIGGHSHDHGDSADAHDHEEDAQADGGHAHGPHVDPEAFTDGDLRKLVLILGVLTVHSFPEGIAVGVSFADLGLEGGVPVFGLVVPVLAVFMTIAISIHNVPEGLALAIPLQSMGVGRWRMVGAAVFSSLPQPFGAVVAFAFVRWARSFLPFGFGFAAGAMVFLVATEFIPEALATGRNLEGDGHRELLAGLVGGVAVMVPLLFV